MKSKKQIDYSPLSTLGSRLSVPTVYSAFLLESISRTITIVFKLIPFLIGVDEAGAKFVTQTLALGAGVGVTLAIVRKGRILFWTAIGLILIVRREFSLKEINDVGNSGNWIVESEEQKAD